MTQKKMLSQYENIVIKNFKKYCTLFLDLPFEDVEKAGKLLIEFSSCCKKAMKQNREPIEIVDHFFKGFSLKKKVKTIFLFLQFLEREVFLFDALEDTYLKEYIDFNGKGSLKELLKDDNSFGIKKNISKKNLRLVLTAHPTQFYPSQVLSIRDDLINAISKNSKKSVKELLLQLGKTPFKNQKKPTPETEAQGLIWYLKNIFYHVFPKLRFELLEALGIKRDKTIQAPILELGFWPGGDRDGNPFVTSNITKQVINLLKNSILEKYLEDLKYLKRRLTFKGALEKVNEIYDKIYRTYHKKDKELGYKNPDEFLKDLYTLRELIIKKHQGLFLEKIDFFINTVYIFGFHFASLDLRQDSRIHTNILKEIGEKIDPNLKKIMQKEERLALLIENLPRIKTLSKEEKLSEISNDAISVLKLAKKAQSENGEKSIFRYIISNTQSSLNIIELLTLFKYSGFDLGHLNFDIIPLFETIDDLESSEKILSDLFDNPVYLNHLKSRKMQQTVMLGFSDGTKDGGYLYANLMILKCKITLDTLSKKYGVNIVFFDGRGGPPSRGGGNTHRFYQSLTSMIKQDQVQLTIQGQTITSNFGTIDSCSYQVERLLTSILLESKKRKVSKEEEEVFSLLGKESDSAYQDIKNDPMFIKFLDEKSPLKYFSKINVGSRPTKRSMNKKLTLEDLRAIPFVASWSLMKQNIPGFYGLGKAIMTLCKKDHKNLLKIQNLYKNNSFFTTVIDNCMQSLLKTNNQLTRYLQKDPVYKEFWTKILEENKRTASYIRKITKKDKLMDNDQVIRKSIFVREDLILPLLIIQQAAMQKLSEKKLSNEEKEIYENVIVKSIAANINASRNSA